MVSPLLLMVSPLLLMVSPLLLMAPPPSPMASPLLLFAALGECLPLVLRHLSTCELLDRCGRYRGLSTCLPPHGIVVWCSLPEQHVAWGGHRAAQRSLGVG